MKVAFTGYYGMGNFGDDLFGSVCLEQVLRWANIDDVALVCPPIEDIAGKALIPGRLARIYRSAGPGGGALRLGSQLIARRRFDLLVVGGGSLFKDRRGVVALADRFSGGRAARAAIGVSIGPFVNGAAEARVREHLKGYDYVSVRDEQSREWIEAQSFTFPWRSAGDLVGAMAFPRLKGRAGIGFAPLGSGGSEPGDGSPVAKFYDHLLVELRKVAIEHDEAVELFVLQAGVDELWTSWFADGLAEHGVTIRVHNRALLSSLALTQRIGACRAMISGRLHGAIVAYLQQVPTVLIEYEAKCSGFLDDIGQDAALRLRMISEHREKIGLALASLLQNPPPPAMSASAYAARAQAHFRGAPWGQRELR